VPQWQRSKGNLILTAGIELSSNQITHFYSTKKNTDEMIRMMQVLVAQYADRQKLYPSWDAASWHVSKKLFEHIDGHNFSVGSMDDAKAAIDRYFNERNAHFRDHPRRAGEGVGQGGRPTKFSEFNNYKDPRFR
jgi:hypothetical protein